MKYGFLSFAPIFGLLILFGHSARADLTTGGVHVSVKHVTDDSGSEGVEMDNYQIVLGDEVSNQGYHMVFDGFGVTRHANFHAPVNQTVELRLQSDYDVIQPPGGSTFGNYVDVTVTAEGAFGLLINGEVVTSITKNFGLTVAGSHFDKFLANITLIPHNINTLAGEDEIIIGRDFAWLASLGIRRDGSAAGVVMMGAGPDGLTAATYTPASLRVPDYYTDVDVTRDGSGVITQIDTEYVRVDVGSILNGFQLSFYDKSQTGTPLVRQYEFENTDPSTTNVLKITSTSGTVSRVRTLEHSQTGTNRWSIFDGVYNNGDDWVSRQTRERLSTTATNFVERIENHDGDDQLTSRTDVYWKEVDSATQTWRVWKIVRDPGGKNFVTERDWYGDHEPFLGDLKWELNYDGSWVAYDYFRKSDNCRGRQVVFTPFENSPAAPPANPESVDPTTFSGKAVVYTRVPESSPMIYLRGAPLTETTYVNGTIVGLRKYFYEILSGSEIGGLSGFEVKVHEYFEEEDETDSDEEYLETVWKFYSPMLNNPNEYLRMKPYSVEYPDGKKVSYVYIGKDWEDDFYNPLRPSDNFTEARIYGTSKTGSGDFDELDAHGFDAVPCDPLQLHANRSIMEITVTNSSGVQYVRRMVWDGSAFEEIYSEDYNYDLSQRLRSIIRSDGMILSRNYYSTSHRLSEEQGFGGVKLTFDQYDNIGQLRQETIVGGTLNGNTVPNLIRKATYDADRHRNSVEIWSGSESIVSEYEYDLARFATEATEEDGVTRTYTAYRSTQYSDDPYNQIEITNQTTGATERVTRYRDGKPQSVTGTGVVRRDYDFSISTEGNYIARISYGGGSVRYVEKEYDWLGRIVRVTTPNTDGGSVDVLTEYVTSGNGIGSVKSIRTSGISAPEIFEYDSFGDLYRRGLDLDDDGVLAMDDDGGDDDRFEEFSLRYAKTGDDWWSVKIRYGFPLEDNDSTKVILSKRRVRMTGHSAGNVIEIRRSSWETGVDESVEIHSVDRTTGIRTRTITSPLFSNPVITTFLGGQVIFEQDASGMVVEREYDALGRLAEVTGARGVSERYEYYTGTFNVKKVFEPNASGAEVVMREFEYLDVDSGPLVLEYDPLRNKTRYAYNSRGQVWRVWGSGDYPKEYGYNAYGERTSLTTYQSNMPNDSTAFPSFTNANTRDWRYDAATGLLEEEEDAMGRITEYRYDSYNRTRYVISPRSVGGNPLYKRFDYDQDSGDLLNRRYRKMLGSDPSDTTDVWDGMTHDVSFVYDRMGRLYRLKDGVTPTLGREFVFSPNSGLLEEEKLRDAQIDGAAVSITLDYKYDADDPRVRGNSVYLNDASSSTVYDIGYEYDSVKGLLSDVERYNGSQTTESFGYSYLGGTRMIDEIESGFGIDRDYGYEPYRNVSNSTVTTDGVEVIASYGYIRNNDWKIVTETQSGELFDRYPGGQLVTEAMVYNGRGELMVARTKLAGSSSALPGRSWTYSYDDSGNRIDASDFSGSKTYSRNSVDGYSSVSNGTNYYVASGFYDSATYEVLLVDGGADAFSTSGDYFVWHSGSNSGTTGKGKDFRFSAYDQNGVAEEFFVNKTKLIPPTTQSMGYDEAGNLVSDGIWQYEYDGENRLVGMSTLSTAISNGVPNISMDFVYDYMGRRFHKSVSRNDYIGSAHLEKEYYIYDGWTLQIVLDESSNPKQSFTWSVGGERRADDLLSVTDHRLGKTFVSIVDGRGNLTGLRDPVGGETVAAYEYGPYGEIIRQTGYYSSLNPFGWSGQFTDRIPGLNLPSLVYYGHRYYNPAMGRFINRDPIKEDGGSNLYAFALNDPLNGGDMLGLWPFGYDDETPEPPPTPEPKPKEEEDEDDYLEFFDGFYSDRSIGMAATRKPMVFQLGMSIGDKINELTDADLSFVAYSDFDSQEADSIAESGGSLVQGVEGQPDYEEAKPSIFTVILALLWGSDLLQPDDPLVRPVKPPSQVQEELVEQQRRKLPPERPRPGQRPAGPPKPSSPTLPEGKPARVPWWQRLGPPVLLPPTTLLESHMGIDLNGDGVVGPAIYGSDGIPYGGA